MKVKQINCQEAIRCFINGEKVYQSIYANIYITSNKPEHKYSWRQVDKLEDFANYCFYIEVK